MPHIVIVEDEPSTSWALAEGLSDDGFTIDTFASAEEAWAWLQRNACDLVISDLRLPGMSGLDLARKLARGPTRRGRVPGSGRVTALPLIVVTAYGSPETLRDLAAAGVVECFPKPFPMDQLRRAVHRALDGAARSARAAEAGAARPRARGPRARRRAA